MCKGGPWFWVLVVLMSRLLYVGSLGVLCLAYIIGGVLWGVGVGTLGIWGVGAGMWMGRDFGVGVFIYTPFMFDFQFQFFAKPNRVSVVGGFCTLPQWVLVMSEQAVGGSVRFS